jgi:ABC-2 type transport system permease protein
MSTPREIYKYRTLVANLVRRDLKAKYRKSILGQVWSLLSPAATLGVYTLIFGFFLKQVPPKAGNGHLANFALYLFCALVIWNFFSSVVLGAIDALQGAGPLLNKIYFPPECPVIANLGGALVQAGFEFGILVVVMLIVGNGSLLFLLFPFVLLLEVCFALGVALVAAVYNIFYRDVRYLVGIAIQILFYITPIVYSVSSIPEHMNGLPLRTMFSFNPLTEFTESSKDLMYLHHMPSLRSWLFMVGAAAASLGIGSWLFSRRAAQVVEEL